MPQNPGETFSREESLDLFQKFHQDDPQYDMPHFERDPDTDLWTISVVGLQNSPVFRQYEYGFMSVVGDKYSFHPRQTGDVWVNILAVQTQDKAVINNLFKELGEVWLQAQAAAAQEKEATTGSSLFLLPAAEVAYPTATAAYDLPPETELMDTQVMPEVPAERKRSRLAAIGVMMLVGTVALIGGKLVSQENSGDAANTLPRTAPAGAKPSVAAHAPRWPGVTELPHDTLPVPTTSEGAPAPSDALSNPSSTSPETVQPTSPAPESVAAPQQTMANFDKVDVKASDKPTQNSDTQQLMKQPADFGTFNKLDGPKQDAVRRLLGDHYGIYTNEHDDKHRAIFWNKAVNTFVSATMIHAKGSDGKTPVVRLRDNASGQEFLVVAAANPSENHGHKNNDHKKSKHNEKQMFSQYDATGLPVFFGKHHKSDHGNSDYRKVSFKHQHHKESHDN